MCEGQKGVVVEADGAGYLSILKECPKRRSGGRAYLVGQGPDGRDEGAGEAEVGDLKAAFPADEQVLRLEVPVAGSVHVCDD